MQKLIFFLWLSFVGASTSWAQSFTQHNFSVPEGLPSSEVYEVFQDRKGFIWFATDNGVAKFDGKEIETFHVKEGLSDPVVFGFHEDKKQRIWFRTFSGKLSYYENGKIKPYRWNEQLSHLLYRNVLSGIYVEKEDLWFSSEIFFGKIDSTGRITKEPVEKSIVSCKIMDKDHMLTASRNGAVDTVMINRQPFPVALSNGKRIEKGIRSVHWKNKLYLSVGNAIFAYDGRSVIVVFTGTAPILSLSKDREDQLWIGYREKGVARFRSTDFKNSWSPPFLQTKSVTKVLQDHEGGFWFTTLEKGAYFIPDLSIEYLPLPDESKITAVLSTPQAILVGNQTGILRAYDPDTKRIRWQKWLGTNVASLFYDTTHIWTSTGLGMMIIDTARKTKINYEAYVAGFYKEQEPEGFVWATGSTRITKFDRQGNCLFYKGMNYHYRRIFVDDSFVYVAPRLGLHIYTKTLDLIATPPQLADFKIAGITPLNDSILLLATIGSGFLVANKRSWQYTQFDANSFFIANNIYAVLKTDSLLWLGTEKGVMVTNIKSLLEGHFSFSSMTERSGLLSNKINFLSAARQGIWAFSDEGVSIIPYHLPRFTSRRIQFYFKELRVNNRSVPLQHTLSLPHNENNIQLTFGYISFTNQHLLTRYRLSSRDAWTSSFDRSIQFASLAPGEYHLELESSVDNIHWVRSHYPLSIHIRPPWWQRWYAQLGAFLVVVSFVYIYFKSRLLIYKQRHTYLKIANEHQQKLIQAEIETLERERSRIAKELHDGVSTTLTAIRLQVRQLVKVEHPSVANEMEEQFQYMIQELKDIIYALTPPGLDRYGLSMAVRNYVEKLNKISLIKIDLSLYGEQTYTHELNIQLFRVIQELLANSFKHSQAQHIMIHINAFEDLLSVVYEDDGIGFSEHAVQKGLGLDNIEARIRAVHGKMIFESGKFGVSYLIDVPITPK